MKFVKVIRSIEWWEYKLPPLLAIGYATALKGSGAFLHVLPHLGFLLLSLTIGAAYVSIINDISDIEDDYVSGKSNRMAGTAPAMRWLFPSICIVMGMGCAFVFYPDWLSIILYTIPWISFSLYSFRPFRLKNRGIWGVLADASGSHIFTSLLMISSVSFFTKQQVDWLWFVSTALWASCYGLRGILWHQFYDRENDILSKVNTFAVGIDPLNFKKREIIIFIIEVASMLVMLYSLNDLLPVVGLIVYLFLMFSRTHRLKYFPVLVIAPAGAVFHIVMADFYQVFFPLSILISAAIREPYVLIMFAVHLMLFPKKTIAAMKDLKYLIFIGVKRR